MKRSAVHLYFFCLVTFFLWGSLYVVNKYVFWSFPPLTALFLRNALAAGLLFLVVRKKGFCPVQKEHIKYFLLSGVIGYSVSTGLVLISNDLLGATMSSLINSANPVFIMLFALILLKERLTRSKLLGILCALCGVALVVGIESGSSTAGLICSVLGVILWALGSVSLRKITQHYEPEQVACSCLVISLPFCFVGALAETGGKLPVVEPISVICLLYAGLICTGVANLLWNKCLSRMDASTCSMFYPLQPMFSALLGVLLLGEAITWNLILGGIVIFAGVIVGLRPSKSAAPR